MDRQLHYAERHLPSYRRSLKVQETRSQLQFRFQLDDSSSCFRSIFSGQLEWLDGRTRDFFFHVIAAQNPRLDFPLLFECLKELTENGRNVADIDYAVGPLLLRWIKTPILAAINGRRSGSGRGGGGSNADTASDSRANDNSAQLLSPSNHASNLNNNNPENVTSNANAGGGTDAGVFEWNLEDVLLEFLWLLINTFKYNSAYLDEAVVSGRHSYVRNCE